MRKIFFKDLLFLMVCLLFSLSLFAQNKTEKNYDPNYVYKADWDDLNTYPNAKWVNDLKFGMYWHWNMNSIPGQSGWYGRTMYNEGSSVYKYHVEHFGDPAKVGYKDLNKFFTAEKFDAKQWVDDARKVGARFILGMAYHHDGFSMYDDSYTKWNSVDMNPHIDVIGELKKEADIQGMKFGATSHLAYHWYFFSCEMYPNKFDADSAPDFYHVQDPAIGPSESWVKEWYKRTTELIDKYDLDMLWFDFGTIEKAFNEKYTAKLAAYFYNHGQKNHKQVALDTKFGFFNHKSQVHDIENGKYTYIRYPAWMSDCTFNYKWFHLNKPEPDPKINTAKYWVYQFIDIVSKNGTLLLNVGPKADGSWVPEWKAELFKVGSWIDVNSKAIYYTHPWHRFGEGPTTGGDGEGHLLGDDLTLNDVRFTCRNDSLFTIVCGWHDKPFTIKSLSSLDIKGLKIKDVSMLGSSEQIKWKQSDKGLTVIFPKEKPCDLAYTFVVKGENLFPKRDEYTPIRVDLDKEFEVDSISLVLNGSNKQLAIADINVNASPRYPKLSYRNVGPLSSISVSSNRDNKNVMMLADGFSNGNEIMGQVFCTNKSVNPYISLKLNKSYHLYYVEILTEMNSFEDLKANGVLKFYKNGILVFEKNLNKEAFYE